MSHKLPLNDFIFLDYCHVGLVEAHFQLGKDVRSQVHKILTRKLDGTSEESLHLLLAQAHDCGETLARRAKDASLPLPLRSAIGEYLDCALSWAKGAGLDEFQHLRLEGISPLERALLLQHDESGCQTGLYRQEDGSVILWHTEEDVKILPANTSTRCG